MKKLISAILTLFIVITIVFVIMKLSGNQNASDTILNGVKYGSEKLVEGADAASDYFIDHKEDIGSFVNDNIIAPAKQGIEDGTFKQGTQDLIDKAGNYAKENDLSGKAKNWFQGVADWFKNGINWAAQNGSVIK